MKGEIQLLWCAVVRLLRCWSVEIFVTGEHHLKSARWTEENMKLVGDKHVRVPDLILILEDHFE